MQGHAPASPHAGFTLVELLTVISIVAVLFAIGVPSYRSVTTSSRVSTEVNSLLGDLQFARSEALKEGLRVTACISNNASSCTGGSDWKAGWIVFSDPNGNATVDSGETVWRVQRPLTHGDTLQAVTGINKVTFNRAGFALNMPNAGFVMSVRDSTNNAAFTRCLYISTGGMMTTKRISPCS